MPGIPPALTPEQFEQVANAIDPNAKVISTHKLVGGLACRMDVLKLELGRRDSYEVVTRQYFSEAGNHVPRESFVLRALSANNIPAPKLVLDEEVTGRIFDRPGIVISHLDGSPNLEPLDPSDWARQVAAAMADLHSVTVPEELESVSKWRIGLLTGWMTAREIPENFTGHELGPEIWHAMKAIWPSVDTSSSQLVHCDLWPGNILWKDEKLVAIVDWEWPARGAPTDDVAFFIACSSYLGLDIEDTFIKAYEEIADKPVQDLLFWKMMATVWVMPDVGFLTKGFAQLGVKNVTPEDARNAHSGYIQKLLNEFNRNKSQ